MALKNAILEKAFAHAGFTVNTRLTGSLDRLKISVEDPKRGEFFNKLSERFDDDYSDVKYDALIVIAKSYLERLTAALEALSPSDVYGPFQKTSVLQRQVCQRNIDRVLGEVTGTPLL